MRSFSFVATLALIFWLTSCSSMSSGKKHPGLSILQGLTTESTVEFSVMTEKSLVAKFTVITPPGETLSPEKAEVISRPDSDWVIHKLRFANLPYSTESYKLMAEAGGQRDIREFKLFSNQGDKLRFAVASCADSRHSKKRDQIYAQLLAQKPEWLFLIGDNVYANQDGAEVKDAGEIWKRYVDARQRYDMYFWKQLVPTYAVWDDNDYGQNNGTQSYALKAESTGIFKAFFAQSYPADPFSPGPGIAGRLALRGMHFSFLDNRSFRDEKGDGQHFGAEQEAWLFEDLKKSQLPTWIISGDQFFGGYHQFESFEGQHPKTFEAFLGKLKEVSTPFVFVSGDRHMTEIMQFPRALLGQLSFEFTSSPLHSKLYPGKKDGPPNPWRVVMEDNSFNFMLFNASLAESSWNIQAQAWGPEALLFQRDLSLTTEALKDFQIEKKQKRRRYRRARWRRR